MIKVSIIFIVISFYSMNTNPSLHIFSAEMVPFKNFDDDWDSYDAFPHIYSLANISWPNIERGKFINKTFEPPSLDVYTQFSLQSSFFIFWGILFLHSLSIFIVDKIWVKNIPQTTNLWNRILHSIQKSSYPFPYNNWHEKKGTCLQHLKRKKLVDQEVLVTIVVNLVFNMILLFPLPIFCKTISLIFCFHSNYDYVVNQIFFSLKILVS